MRDARMKGRNPTRLALVALASLIVGASPAQAAGFELNEQGAESSGTASAGTAREGTPEASHFNPSLVPGTEGWSLSLHLAVVSAQLEAEALDRSWVAELESDVSTPGALHFTYAWDSWALGSSITVSHASGLRWPSDWAGRFEVQESALRVLRLAPWLAYRFGDWSFALGPQVDWGYLRTIRALDFIAFEGSAEVLMTGFGVGAHASMAWRPAPGWTLGLAYRSRTRLRLSGDADFETPPTFGFSAPDQSVSTDFWLPDRLALGLAFQSGDWRLLLDMGLTVWAVQERQTLHFSHEATPEIVREMEWSTTAWVRGGAEWSGWDGFICRAGLGFDPSPVSERYLTPISPDSSRFITSLGAGWTHSSGLGADLYYQAAWMTGAEPDGEEAIQARFGGSVHTLGIGLKLER